MVKPVNVSRAVTNSSANDIVAKHISDGLFISGFKLAISSDNSNCPADRVRELYGRGDNINQGRGENYVYIVPTRTNTYSDAITGARIGIPASYNASQVGDLTSGASDGGYRYLITRKEKGKAPIVDWCLIRGREKIPAGWHCKTDINQDRKGDYLYLCSKLW